jgi:predicted dehydrogenase
MGLSRGRALALGFARQPGVAVKYLCDVDKKRLATAAKAMEAALGNAPPKQVTDFRRILDDKEVDALVCATPNHWHGPATILACAAGKHVYVEKPCSHNPREGELMIEAARKYRRAVQMGTQRRSSAGTIEAMEQLRDGIIGRVYHARCWYYSLRPSIGHSDPEQPPPWLDYELWQGPAPRRPYKKNVVHYNWHWFWHWGNGELGNNGVHTLDLCRWGLGVEYPIRVVSAGGRYRYDDDQETPDTHTVAFEFEGERMIQWEGLSCNRNRTASECARFFGEAGALSLEHSGNYVVYDKNNKAVKRRAGSNAGEREHIANFIAAIRSDEPQALNAEIAEGHKSTLLCHLGNIAHRTGRTLNCNPANGHIKDDPEAMKLWSREYEPGWEPKV